MSLADHYPAGMSLCDSEGMAGNCGHECRGYILGECPIVNEIEVCEEEIKTPRESHSISWKEAGF